MTLNFRLDLNRRKFLVVNNGTFGAVVKLKGWNSSNSSNSTVNAGIKIWTQGRVDTCLGTLFTMYNKSGLAFFLDCRITYFLLNEFKVKSITSFV